MSFVALSRAFAILTTVTLASVACDDDATDDPGGGGAGGGDTSSASSSGSSSGSGTGGYESCLATMQVIDVDCAGTPVGTLEWVGVGAGKCMGSQDGNGFARFLISAAQTDPDGNPMVLGLRIEPESGNAPQQGDRIELTAVPPQVVSATVPLATTLEGAAVIEPMLFGGALGFLKGDSDDAEVILEAAITQQELVDGGTVSGTFRLLGGTFTTLDSGGNQVETPDPSAEVRGCFHVPYELHPIELDD